jgi:type IX secretion system PorP/SprF family membrane protein
MKTIYSLSFLLFISHYLTAQDPHFSQFFANRVYLNAAYAGFDEGTTVNVNYRNQWFGVPDGDIGAFGSSFATYNITLESQISCFMGLESRSGVAISFFNDEAGEAPLRTLGGSFGYSYEQPLIRKSKSKLKRLDLRGGFNLGVMQKSLKGDMFVYSSQLDPVWGLQGQDYSILDLRSGWFTNLSAGFMFRGYVKNKSKETLFTAGFNFANVNTPTESLREVGDEITLPMRMTFHAGSTHKIVIYKGVRSPTYISPQFRWDVYPGLKLNLQTAGFFLFSKAYYLGGFFQYNFPNSNNLEGSSGGALVKNTSTIIFNAGVDLRTLLDTGNTFSKRESGVVLGFTYDVNLTGLNSTNTLGAIELNLNINFGQGKKRGCGTSGKFELYDGKCPASVKF